MSIPLQFYQPSGPCRWHNKAKRFTCQTQTAVAKYSNPGNFTGLVDHHQHSEFYSCDWELFKILEQEEIKSDPKFKRPILSALENRLGIRQGPRKMDEKWKKEKQLGGY